jgi:hypothetical protein
VHTKAFLNSLGIKHQQLTHRFPNGASPGFGMRKLLSLLEFANIEDMPITTESLLGMRRGLEEQLNVRVQKQRTGNLFLKSPRGTVELMIPARSSNPLGDCPALSLPYSDASWHRLKPLRMVDIDRCDLRFQIQNDQVLYQKNAPRFALYTLDCYALLLKYSAYCRVTGSPSDVMAHRIKFLHQAVILPALVDDQIALWFRNLYTDVFLYGTPINQYLQSDWDGQYSNLLGADFYHMVTELYALKDDVVKDVISPQTVLSSLTMGFGGLSFSEYYLQLMLTTQIPEDQNVTWLECVKQLRWLELIVILLSLEGNTPESLTTRRALLRMFRLWQMMKPWQELSTASYYRTLLQMRVEGIILYLQTE